MSMDIRVKLIDWNRFLGVWTIWTIWTPREQIQGNVCIFAKAKLQGWIRVIVRNIFQMSKHILNSKAPLYVHTAFLWGSLIPWEPERAEMLRSSNFRE